MLLMELVFIFIKLNLDRVDLESGTVRRISVYESLPEILAMITAYIGIKKNFEIYLLPYIVMECFDAAIWIVGVISSFIILPSIKVEYDLRSVFCDLLFIQDELRHLR